MITKKNAFSLFEEFQMNRVQLQKIVGMLDSEDPKKKPELSSNNSATTDDNGEGGSNDHSDDLFIPTI